MKKSSAELKGKYFLSFEVIQGEKAVQLQGYVVGKIDENHYLTKLFSWLDGTETHQQIFNIRDLKKFIFYDEWVYFDEAAKRFSNYAVKKSLAKRE